jgi:hypothetical protein
VSTGHLANLECGRRVPSAALAADLIAVLELPPDLAERLTEVAAPAAGRSRPGYALEGRRSHEGDRTTVVRLAELPTLSVWAERQTSGNAEQIRAFLDACDRRRLAALDRELRTVGRALREFVRADDELVMRHEWAETVAQALDNLET